MVRTSFWRGLPLLTLVACGGNNSNGASNPGAANDCTAPAGCGGAIDGTTWQIDSSCNLGDQGPVLAEALGLPAACDHAFPSLVPLFSGTLSFANQVETDDLTEGFTATAVLTPACLGLTSIDAATCSGVQDNATQSGYNATCDLAGANCTCSLSFAHPVPRTTSYRISGGQIVYPNPSESPPVTYCVSGTTLKAVITQPHVQNVVNVLTAHRL